MKHILAATEELERLLRVWQAAGGDMSPELVAVLREAPIAPIYVPAGVDLDVRPRPHISCSIKQKTDG